VSCGGVCWRRCTAMFLLLNTASPEELSWNPGHLQLNPGHLQMTSGHFLMACNGRRQSALAKTISTSLALLSH